MRYVSAQLPHPIRLVGLALSLTNAQDVAEWLGVPQAGKDNFLIIVENVSQHSYKVNSDSVRCVSLFRIV